MPDREKTIEGLEMSYKYSNVDEDYTLVPQWIVLHALALLKAQEPVKPILARGWYWCGGVGCRNSLTSALDDGSPARKPNYCEKCGRAVKWK